MSKIQYVPTPSIEPQTILSKDTSGASQGVYTYLVNDDDGLGRKLSAVPFWSYMRAAPNDTQARPNGHMILEVHYSHSLSFPVVRNALTPIAKYEAPNPEPQNDLWWRSMIPPNGGTPNGLKRRTVSIGAGQAAVGDFILFQNSPRDV